MNESKAMGGKRSVVIVSGGMDSAVLLAQRQSLGYTCRTLSFNYGQRHARELAYAEEVGGKSAGWDLIDLTSLTHLLTGSSLSDPTVEVPLGHYAEETMRATVVPNRNAMMLSIAYAVAISWGAEEVAFGAHAGDHDVYPDCRLPFVSALSHALTLGNTWASPTPHIVAPFVKRTKANLVTLGAHLGVDFAQTYSCYQGGVVHCGLCGTCTERRAAFKIAGVVDPTPYAVSWEETCRVGKIDPATDGKVGG